MNGRPTHKLWCLRCGYATPQVCRPDLPITAADIGLLWECSRCGVQVSRSHHTVSVSERIEGGR